MFLESFLFLGLRHWGFILRLLINILLSRFLNWLLESRLFNRLLLNWLLRCWLLLSFLERLILKLIWNYFLISILDFGISKTEKISKFLTCDLLLCLFLLPIISENIPISIFMTTRWGSRSCVVLWFLLLLIKVHWLLLSHSHIVVETHSLSHHLVAHHLIHAHSHAVHHWVLHWVLHWILHRVLHRVLH